MKDKDQQLLWEAYNTGAEGNYIEVATDKGMELMTPEEAEAYRKKKAVEKKQAGGKTKTEGAFAGPGGNFDEEGWGEETYDDPDDPAFNPPSDAELVNTAHQIGVEELIVLDGEGLLTNREEILKAIEDHDLEQDKRESTAGDWRAEDAEFDRETDQDRYGYPGDR